MYLKEAWEKAKEGDRIVMLKDYRQFTKTNEAMGFEKFFSILRDIHHLDAETLFSREWAILSLK